MESTIEKCKKQGFEFRLSLTLLQAGIIEGLSAYVNNERTSLYLYPILIKVKEYNLNIYRQPNTTFFLEESLIGDINLNTNIVSSLRVIHCESSQAPCGYLNAFMLIQKYVQKWHFQKILISLNFNLYDTLNFDLYSALPNINFSENMLLISYCFKLCFLL